MDKFCLKGKVALITGSSSGMGRETARLFAKCGAKVFLAARRENRLEEIKAEIEAAGGEAGYLKTDVSKEEDCKAAVKACVEQFGRLDILVNSAGIGGSARGLEGELDTDLLNRVMNIDLYGVLFMIKYSYPEMNKVGGGSIVSISSIAALKNMGCVAYAAAKGGIKSADLTLACYLSPLKIRINSIYPGGILTEMSEKALEDKELHDSICKAVPLGYIGFAEDIAYCALYLASDASSYVTGQTLIVDGGWTCT